MIVLPRLELRTILKDHEYQSINRVQLNERGGVAVPSKSTQHSNHASSTASVQLEMGSGNWRGKPVNRIRSRGRIPAEPPEKLPSVPRLSTPKLERGRPRRAIRPRSPSIIHTEGVAGPIDVEGRGAEVICLARIFLGQCSRKLRIAMI